MVPAQNRLRVSGARQEIDPFPKTCHDRPCSHAAFDAYHKPSKCLRSYCSMLISRNGSRNLFSISSEVQVRS
eukprot:33393_4